jgi:small redox-active disulfide protein 2
MKRILVLGPGCPRCETLADAAREAADDLGIQYELEKLTDIKEFPKYGLMMTPGLVVDGKLADPGQGPVRRRDQVNARLGRRSWCTGSHSHSSWHPF